MATIVCSNVNGSNIQVNGRTIQAPPGSSITIDGDKIIIGDNELAEGSAKLRNMETGTETIVPLNDGFFEHFFAAYVENDQSGLLQQLEEMKG